MTEIKKGVLGVLDAALAYFHSVPSELSEKAKRHISRKSQDEQSELAECRQQLQSLTDRSLQLCEEKKQIEAELSKVQFRKSTVHYYNTEYNNELFGLQQSLMELEAGD
jgi:tryptophan 2,3-dioxygenase